METVLISGKDFSNVKEAVDWANSTVGRVVPHNSNLKITNVLHFQVVPEGNTFSMVLQVEIERNTSMSSMVIKMREEMNPSEEVIEEEA